MTSRTHDLAAVTLVSLRFLAYPPVSLNWETILGIGLATLIGGIIPDIDNVASNAWKFDLTPWEDDATRKTLSGHRNLSHSIIGGVLFSAVVGLALQVIKIPQLNPQFVLEAFAIAFLSHLVTDSLTHEGVPWFYPIDIHLGFPPFKSLRMKTGGIIEKFIVFPLLLILTVFIYYAYHTNLQILLKNVV